MRPDLFDLFELDELKKYYTGEELGGHRAGTDATGAGTGEQA
jgi:succinate dehydrogenase / fumarate reductase flavoprotein subunit